MTNGYKNYLFWFTEEALSRKTREWERRLFRGFHVAPAAGDDSILLNVEMGEDGERRESETGADKFKRMARLALLNRERLARPPKHLSHIGRSTSSESFKSRQSLKKAMDAAKKMVDKANSGPSPVPPSSAADQCQTSDDKLLGSGSTLAMDRKDSTLSVVAESVRSVTPTPSMRDGGASESIPELDPSGSCENLTEQEDRPPSGVPSAPPTEVSLMDEPLPDIMSSVKATSPQQKTKSLKRASPAPPPTSGEEPSTSPPSKVRDLAKMSQSVPDLNEVPASADTTTILMENETRTVDSPARMRKDKAASPGPSGSPQQCHKLSRDPTLEMDSVAVNVGVSPSGSSTTIDVPFVPGAGEGDKIPLINVEQQEEQKGGINPSVIISPSSLPAVSIVATSSPAPTSNSTETSQPSTSSDNSSLSVIGKKIDDVKTIKRPKPGGSWF